MSQITASMVKELREITDAGMMECKKALVEMQGDMQAAIDYLRKNGQAKAAKRAGKIAAEGVILASVSADNKKACMIEVNCETDFVARDASFKAFAEKLVRTGLSIDANDVSVLMSQSVDGEALESTRENLVSKIGENINARRVTTMTASGCVGAYLHGERIGVLVALDKDNVALAKDIAMHVAAMRPLATDASGLSQDLLAKEREIVKAQAEQSGKPANIIEKMVEGRLQKFVQEVCLIHQPFVKNPDQKVEDLLKASGAKVLAFARFEVGEGIEKQAVDFRAEVNATIQGV